MLFSPRRRCLYTNNPLIQVVCALQFPDQPELLETGHTLFHEGIRTAFPRYQPAKDHRGHHFVSADGRYRLSLTSNTITLSANGYHRWEDFIIRMDNPLIHFFQLYHPECFLSVNLRYVNAISRVRLGVPELLWDDLIQPQYLGLLGEVDVEESWVYHSSVKTELLLPGQCRVKLHTGLGHVGEGERDTEVKFIIDGDFSISGTISPAEIPDLLSLLHDYGTDLFRGALTDELHKVLGSAPMW